MKKYLFVFALLATTLLSSCISENYANGERIGLVTQFSHAGVIWKSWEGHLNLTQTGMNSSSAEPFNFSIDNDREDPKMVARIDSAAQLGWKVKLVYHETMNKNWLSNRGETDHFISEVVVLDKSLVTNHLTKGEPEKTTGHVIDTVFVVIDKSQLRR